MKSTSITAIIFLSLLHACKEQEGSRVIRTNELTQIEVEIPKTAIEKSLLDHDREISLWKLNGAPYSGYAVVFYSDSVLKEKTGFLNGKLESKSLTYFEDGQLKQLSNYHNGKLHGEKKMWSLNTNHVLLSHLNYQFGKPHGEQRTWYPTGELHKILNMNMGKEEGIQRAYRKNGAVYANYEAKEGRIFGLKKTALCFDLEEENIRHEK